MYLPRQRQKWKTPTKRTWLLFCTDHNWQHAVALTLKWSIQILHNGWQQICFLLAPDVACPIVYNAIHGECGAESHFINKQKVSETEHLHQTYTKCPCLQLLSFIVVFEKLNNLFSFIRPIICQNIKMKRNPSCRIVVFEL